MVTLHRMGSDDSMALLDSEFTDMLEALRRDLRSEQALSHCTVQDDRTRHLHNYRMDLRLLEALQPKHPWPLVAIVMAEPPGDNVLLVMEKMVKVKKCTARVTRKKVAA